MSQSDFSTVNDSYLTKQWLGDTRYMRYKESDGYYYLDPNNEEVLELICNGVAELVQNYDVDGIHFDDYFYNLTPEEYGYDADTAHAATDRLVQRVYQTVKSINPAVQFGVSPGGNYYDARLPTPPSTPTSSPGAPSPAIWTISPLRSTGSLTTNRPPSWMCSINGSILPPIPG